MSDSVRYWELLQDYVRTGNEKAFAQIVADHVDMVYSACLRQTGNRHLAEEITQAVFIVLARKAASLHEGTVLSAWLHKAARLTTMNALRMETRRKIHERKAAEMHAEMNCFDPTWQQLAPVLDEAVARLSPNDRAAIVLRFFQQKSVAEVGRALGVSEDAAGMRVSRALEKLRTYFRERRISVTALSLDALISSHALQSAPPGLAQSASCSAVSAARGGAAGRSGEFAKATLQDMATAKAKSLVLAAVAIIAITLGGFFFIEHLLTRRPAPPPEPRATSALLAAPSRPALRASSSAPPDRLACGMRPWQRET